MGTITTEGKASRLVQFDRLNTVVTFHSRSRLTGKTIKTALEDCEKFLHTMSDMGIGLWMPLTVPVVCMMMDPSVDSMLP